MNATLQDGLDANTAHLNHTAAAVRKDVQALTCTALTGAKNLQPEAESCMTSDGSWYRVPPAATLHESAQQLPAPDGNSEPVSPPAPALLQLEATVTEVNRYQHLQPRMTLQFGGGEYSGYVRLDAPAGAREGQRYVVILSLVQCGEQREGG